MKHKRVWQLVQRPSTQLAAAILGESLESPVYRDANEPPVKPRRKTSVIPVSGYCYHQFPAEAWFTPCRYYINTSYGTVKCAFLGVESYDQSHRDARHRVERHFGSASKAMAAGVAQSFWLTERIKICGVNDARGEDVGLDAFNTGLALYADAVAEKHLNLDCPGYFDAYRSDISDKQKYLLSAAWTRFELWLTLCHMVIDEVPVESIQLMKQTDELFKAKTERSDTQVACDSTPRLPYAAEPEKQFWYLYRKNFK